MRVSQLVAGLTCLSALAVLTAVLRSGKCAPEKLWVNRAALAAEAPEEAAPAEAEDAPDTAPEEDFFDMLEWIQRDLDDRDDQKKGE